MRQYWKTADGALLLEKVNSRQDPRQDMSPRATICEALRASRKARRASRRRVLLKRRLGSDGARRTAWGTPTAFAFRGLDRLSDGAPAIGI
jgi:hypothetical protein